MSHILVIDDDPIIRQITKAYLTAKGHAISVANDGKEGVRKFEQEDVDLVITDLMMPKMHGFEVVDAIKLSSKGLQTPVILLTADKDEPELAKYERRRFQDNTLNKPFDMPALDQMVNDLLQEFADRLD